MQRVAVAVLVLFAIVLIGLNLTNFLDGITNFRTDEATDLLDGDTGASANTVAVVLTNAIWDKNKSNIVSITSNISSEDCSADSYVAVSKTLTVGGLLAGQERTLTVVYLTSGLGDYPGADEASKFGPTILIACVCMIPIAVLIYAFKGR